MRSGGPVHAHGGDRQRAGNGDCDCGTMCGGGNQPHCEERQRDHEQLTEVHAQVETQQARAGKSRLGKGTSARLLAKPSPCTRPNTKTRREPPGPQSRTQYVLGRDHRDGQRDRRLHVLRGQAEDTVRGQEQRGGVRHGENRGLREQLAPRDAEEGKDRARTGCDRRLRARLWRKPSRRYTVTCRYQGRMSGLNPAARLCAHRNRRGSRACRAPASGSWKPASQV